jgi:hypothetical protein
MKRVILPAMLVAVAAVATSWSTATITQAAGPPSPTFNKDVLPVLQKQCQECHRPNSIAPMSFVTYTQTRPYARAIEKAVVARTMPPWFADPTVGHFKNTKLLSDSEIELLSAWAKNGAPEGDPKDKPEPVQFTEGWTIGKPDIIVQFPKDVQLPATGTIDQSNLVVKAHFERDVWVKAAEVRPGNAKVVHHMKAIIRPPNSTWLAHVPEGELYVPQRGEGADRSVPQPSASGPLPVQDILAKYNPGVAGQRFTVGDAAKFIAAGSDIVFEIHYTTTGKPEVDRSMVGIVLADDRPAIRHLTVTGTNNGNIDIPPGEPNYEVKAESTLAADAKLVWVQPHQHYRGRYFEMRVVYPDGETKTVLRVPNYRFDWQVGYELAEPLDLPKGTRLETVGRYDNSAANKFNPDPTARVKFGLQSNDEMHVAFMGVLVDVNADPTKLFVPRQRPAPAGPTTAAAQ